MLTPLCLPFRRPPFALPLQMAAAPQQVGFNLRVWSEGRDEPFSVPMPQEAIEAAELKACIEASPTGKRMGFAAGDWNVYLATASGLKSGGPLPLPFNHSFAPAAGSIVNVWVEPKPDAAAGEPWEPCSWAGGGLGCWAGLTSHWPPVTPLPAPVPLPSAVPVLPAVAVHGGAAAVGSAGGAAPAVGSGE